MASNGSEQTKPRRQGTSTEPAAALSETGLWQPCGSFPHLSGAAVSYVLHASIAIAFRPSRSSLPVPSIGISATS
jgi:hypothetical protein